MKYLESSNPSAVATKALAALTQESAAIPPSRLLSTKARRYCSPLLDNSGRDLEFAQTFAQYSPGLIPVAGGIGILLLRITQLNPVKLSNDVSVKMYRLHLFLFHLEPSMVLENDLGRSAELAAYLREALHGFVCLVHMLPGGYLAGDAEIVATGA